MMGYGTGAIMAVPAHDTRDFEFAKKFGLEIRTVVQPPTGVDPQGFTGDGVSVNSGSITGLTTPEAKKKIAAWLQEKGLGKATVQYKLRDWLFSRQRYWGEPIPIVHCEKHGAIPIPESELPLRLPEMTDYTPSGNAEPPLAKATEWVNTKCPQCGGPAKRETNTMPQWAGSCWYYLRYIDPNNDRTFVAADKEKYWMPVDLYIGGVEHAVLHLLYSRFWHKVLFDLGHVSTPEPFQRLVNQGLILGEQEYTAFYAGDTPVSASEVRDLTEEVIDQKTLMVGHHRETGAKITGSRVKEEEVERNPEGYFLKSDPQIKVDARAFKMSKSRGNVVNPDDIVRDYGADCFRLYEMYMGPLTQQKPWNTRDIVGMSRFLNSVWRNLIGEDDAPAHQTRVTDGAVPEALDRQMHRTIKKVGEDIESMAFNTAIAKLIELNNEMNKLPAIPRELAENFTLMLAPLAPHVAEEIWHRLGHERTLARRPWPTFDPAKLIESTMDLPVQVNGKLRDKITVPADAEEAAILQTAELAPGVQQWIDGKTFKKKIYVPRKLVN